MQNAAYGLCSQGVNGVNSDVVMILHLDPNNRSVSILSIPRDLFVPNARTNGANKIDAALYQGPSQLVAAINEDFGHPDPALRGAQLRHLRQRGRRPRRGQDVLPRAGLRRLLRPQGPRPRVASRSTASTPCRSSGPATSSTSRRGSRPPTPAYWPSENQSDLARIRRDHEFLRVLATAVSKNGLSNPITDEQLISGVAPQLDVDRTFSTADMVGIVLDFHSVNVNSAPQLTLPVEVDQFGSYLYQGGLLRRHRVPLDAQDQPGHRPVPRHRRRRPTP